ncbi:MAG: hypothetical protein HY247_01800 [archaeon]|nr:MAG: hypothetical protein HY247_01800 [archaeon]
MSNSQSFPRALPLIFDLYRDSAIGVVGCWSRGLQRDSCELDVLVAGDSRKPPATVNLKGTVVDLIFVDEKEVLSPRDPEKSVAIALMKPVKDSSLIFSTAMAAQGAVLADSMKKSASFRLGLALKALGRAEEALEGGRPPEADFWAQACAFDFARAFLYTKETMPAPSHLFSQMKGRSVGAAKSFEAFVKGASLGAASREACRMRLEGVGVLYDGQLSSATRAEGPGWGEERLETVKTKVEQLSRSKEHSESFSFLGQEMVAAMSSMGLPLGETLVADLGLTRTRDAVERTIPLLKSQVSALARRL